MSIAIASLLVLVIVAVVAIPILIRVIGEAGRRDTNGGGDETSEQDRDPHSGSGRE